jgi:hypothetical protein
VSEAIWWAGWLIMYSPPCLVCGRVADTETCMYCRGGLQPRNARGRVADTATCVECMGGLYVAVLSEDVCVGYCGRVLPSVGARWSLGNGRWACSLECLDVARRGKAWPTEVACTCDIGNGVAIDW